MSIEEELKWMTTRYSWRYIPVRYQAMVATIVSALLYFNVFNMLFVEQGDRCGTFVRPQLEGYENPRGWIWDTFARGDYDSAVNCSDGFYTGLLWSALFSFAGIAICGAVMRRAIKREGAEPGATNTANGSKIESFTDLTDMAGAILRRANPRRAKLSDENISGEKVRNTERNKENTRGANLRGINLSKENLSGEDLHGVNLTKANLSGANLTGANLQKTDLRYVNLAGATMPDGSIHD
jgi:hypothetical protein